MYEPQTAIQQVFSFHYCGQKARFLLDNKKLNKKQLI